MSQNFTKWNQEIIDLKYLLKEKSLLYMENKISDENIESSLNAVLKNVINKK